MNIKLLKQKDLTLLIMGKLVSLLGSNMQQFALSLYVLALTGSATIFASIVSVSILPRLLLSPIAGVFGDWFNRKKSIVLLDFLNAFILAVFAFIFFTNGNLTLPMIYILVILLEITEIFFHSSMSAVIPSIVKKEDLLTANSLNSLVLNIGNLLSPIIAAFIYGIFGLLIVLVVNSISFFLSALSELFIKIPKNQNRPEKINMNAFIEDFKEGIGIIRANKLISTIIGLGTIINFSIFPLFSIGFIYVIKVVLEASDFQFGLYQMVISASMIVAPILISGFIKKMNVGKLCYNSFLYIAVLIFLMSFIPSDILVNNYIPRLLPYILLLMFSFLIGLFVTIANITVGTLFNKIVPIELMGRTSSVLTLSVTIFIPIGQMFFGYLYDTILPSYVIAISGLIMIITVLKYKKPLYNIVNSIGDEEEEKMKGDVLINEF